MAGVGGVGALGGRTASEQHTAGVLVLSAAVLLSTCWRMLEDPDPALLPPLTAGYGWQAAAAAYAQWPAGGGWPQKCIYFLRHLPQLLVHTNVYHWPCLSLPLICSALATRVSRRWVHGASLSRAMVLYWSIAVWVGAAAFALPPGPPQLMACDEYRRTRIQQAMACTTAARQYQALSQLTRDWRCGAYVSMLLLPAGIYPALASAVMYAGCLASCATVEARYGVAAGALQHAAVPLTWQGLAGAPIWQHLGELALPFACTVLLPWAISFFLAALRLRLPPPPPPEEQRQQQQQRQLAAGARGVVAHGSGSGNGRSKVAGAGGKAGAEQHAGDLGGEEGGAPITPTSAASSSSGRQGSSPQGSSSPFDSPCRPPSTQNPLPDLRAGGADTAQLPDQATGPLGPAGDLLARPPRRPGGQALYRSPVSSDRRALLHVKLVGTDPGAEADFMEKLAGTLSDVLMPVQLAGAPQATPALQLVHVSAFSGCIQLVALLEAEAKEQLQAQLLHTALQQRLPANMELRALQLLPADALTPAAAAAATVAAAGAGGGVWCEPPALLSARTQAAGAATAPQELQLRAPPGLLAAVSAAGRGLRVVVTDGGSPAPVVDWAAAPGSDAWPADGVLRLQLPACEGPLVMLHLLSTAGAVTGAGGAAAEHAADELLGTAAVLALPERAACLEVEGMFALMQKQVLEEEGGAQQPPAALDVQAAARSVFGNQLRAFVLDYGQLLAPGRSTHDQQLVRHMQTFLAVQGMRSCLQLLRSAGVAVGAQGRAQAARDGGRGDGGGRGAGGSMDGGGSRRSSGSSASAASTGGSASSLAAPSLDPAPAPPLPPFDTPAPADSPRQHPPALCDTPARTGSPQPPTTPTTPAAAGRRDSAASLLQIAAAPAEEQAYRRWRQQQRSALLDWVALCTQAALVLLPAAMVCAHGPRRLSLSGGAQVPVAALVAAWAALGQAPAALRVAAPAAYARHRDAVWALSLLAAALALAAVPALCGLSQPSLPALVFNEMVMPGVMVYLVLPLLLQLQPGWQLLTSAGHCICLSVSIAASSQGQRAHAMGVAGHGLLLVASIVLAYLLDARSREKWLRSRLLAAGAGQVSGASSAAGGLLALAAGSPGKKGWDA